MNDFKRYIVLDRLYNCVVSDYDALAEAEWSVDTNNDIAESPDRFVLYARATAVDVPTEVRSLLHWAIMFHLDSQPCDVEKAWLASLVPRVGEYPYGRLSKSPP
jgi:hypothetical protein